MEVVIWRARASDAPALTHVARHSVCCRDPGRLDARFRLSGEGPVRELEHMWVAPEHMGRGGGARRLDHAVALLSADGARVLRIASDPYAEGFYLAMGACRVGEVASTPRGRMVPLLVIEVSGESAYPI